MPYCSYLCTGLDRPRVLQEVETPRILRQSAHEGFKLYALAAFTLQERSLVLISVRG